ncbi:MAG: AlpA family phage regulatory protein [Nitrospirae bacterium]|nr:AlpA family phage regulatory protein [Nitrospirota bacterium]
MDEAILTRKKVIELTGRSATSLWRDVNAGAFPPPRQISAARIGWLASEVQAWLESRPVSLRKQSRWHKIPVPD